MIPRRMVIGGERSGIVNLLINLLICLFISFHQAVLVGVLKVISIFAIGE